MNTHVIYRIVCFATGKCYIGQTINPKSRRNGHFSSLRHNNHYNDYLQRAFNQYGEQSFYFEVLESGISTEAVDQREQWWIDRFDSYRDGFNLTPYGIGRYDHGKPCTFDGVLYATKSDAARALGVPFFTLCRWLKRGYTGFADLPKRAKPCVWNGVRYSSIGEAARAQGVPNSTMRYRLQRGYTHDDEIIVTFKRRSS